MDKTKIDWRDSTWNPVTGCLHGCKYCYARSICNRFEPFDMPALNDFHINTDVYLLENKVMTECRDGKLRLCAYPYGFAPTFHRYRLNDYMVKKGRNIFVCSMADLFGSWIPDEVIEEVFKACDKAPQHNYLFLTKNVERYWQYGVPLEGNMWYGTSITMKGDIEKADLLPAFANTFISIEPLLEDIRPNNLVLFRQVDWIIIGAETGRRKDKVVPERKWIEDIVSECRRYDKPVFMKSSLADIWGEPLIQEFPEPLRR